MINKPKLELTWIGKENRPRLESRIMLGITGKSIDNFTKFNDININITPSASAAGAGPSFGMAFALYGG